MRKLDGGLAVSLFGVSLVGPWTIPVYRLFGAGEYERVSVIDMAVHLAKKIPASFACGFYLFVIVPVFFIGLRAARARASNVVQASIAIACEVASLATLPLFWIPYGGAERANVMGDVLVVDLVTMYVVHAVLVFGARALPAWSLACGPLFGIARYLRSKTAGRPSSILGGILALYANVGGLYRAYVTLHEEFGLEVLTQTVRFDEWRGYELYAAVNVIGGFVLICASIAPPSSIRTWRGIVELLEIVLYVLLLNGNVAAAWIASEGFWRAPLVPVKRFIWSQNDNRESRPNDAPAQGDGGEVATGRFTRRVRHSSRNDMRP